MCDINKNQLLALFHREGKEKDLKQIQAHVDLCKDCQTYLAILNQTETKLNQWTNEQPDPQIFDHMMAEITASSVKPSQKKVNIPIAPFLEILFAMLSILSLIHIVQNKLTLLPIWQTLEEMAFVHWVGSYGITVILFLCVGIFITLSLTPIFYLSSRHTQYQNSTL